VESPIAKPPLAVVPLTLNFHWGLLTPIPTFCAAALDTKSNVTEAKVVNNRSCENLTMCLFMN
jgi:hypothetical protein